MFGAIMTETLQPTCTFLSDTDRPVKDKPDSDSVTLKSMGIPATESFCSDRIYRNRIVQLFHKLCLCAAGNKTEMLNIKC